MNPVADTVNALYSKAPEAFAAWALLGLFPVLVPAALALFLQGRVSAKVRFTLSVAARIFGWPALLVVLVGLPWFVFELFLVPVILDAYPISRTLLAGPLSVTNWLVRNWYWSVPILWIGWVFFVSLRFRRIWRAAKAVS